MKKFTYLFLLSALLIGQNCGTLRDRSEAAQRHVAMENKQTTSQWSFRDSADRHWYFRSDSPFYYHPDHGLYGRSGWLTIGQEQLRWYQGQERSDSRAYHQQEQSQVSYITHPLRRAVWRYTVAGLLGALLLWGLYRWWRR
ncbi:MAG TPA: hypothetical protein PKA53_03035, partial [Sphingobacterium sp.]|nr:hypothetical protein [Sphingobacterium sp.]